jgi:hypothetical protein
MLLAQVKPKSLDGPTRSLDASFPSPQGGALPRRPLTNGVRVREGCPEPRGKLFFGA